MESDSAFVAPEGVYSVTEEHKPPIVPAPSGTSAQLHPTRLSTVTVHFNHSKHANSPGFAQLLGGNLNKDSRRDKERDREKDRDREKQLLDERSLSSSDTPDDNLTSPDVTSPPGQTTNAQDLILSHEPHQKLFAHPSISGKKKPSSSKPKHNMRTTSSTFITRMQSAEGLNKIIASKQGEVTFMFFNSGKTFLWYEVGANAKVCIYVSNLLYTTANVKRQEPLTRISFSAFPTCHDVNTLTASPERLDVVIGFSTGDLVWFGLSWSGAHQRYSLRACFLDPIASRYGRLNKQV